MAVKNKIQFSRTSWEHCLSLVAFLGFPGGQQYMWGGGGRGGNIIPKGRGCHQEGTPHEVTLFQ